MNASGGYVFPESRARHEPRRDQLLPFVPPARLQTAIEYHVERLGPARGAEVHFGSAFVAAQRRDALTDEVLTDAFTT